MSRASKRSKAKTHVSVQVQTREQRPAQSELSRWALPEDAFALDEGSEQVELSILKSVAPAKVEWIAEGRAPQGALCVVAGETGTCKSLLAVDWAAGMSQGTEYADAALIAHAVDMPGPLLRARLDAAEANVERVGLATLAWPQPGDDVSLDALDRRVATLAAGMQDGRACKLLVIDNLEAWAGGLDASPCRADPLLPGQAGGAGRPHEDGHRRSGPAERTGRRPRGDARAGRVGGHRPGRLAGG